MRDFEKLIDPDALETATLTPGSRSATRRAFETFRARALASGQLGPRDARGRLRVAAAERRRAFLEAQFQR
jgi:hypothetical protein